ncbi:MAG: signal peptidase I [Acidimicrobiia bacterium]
MTVLHDEAPPSDKPAKSTSALKSLVEWIIVLGGALLVAFVVKTFLIQAFYIPSSSMERTLLIGDRVLVNKLSYDVGEVERGDIVVFERPPHDTGNPDIKDLIKRIVALPGETVELRDGEVFIDGRRLDEPYLQAHDDANVEPKKVPAGHYWVMGDNRSQSKDSRFFGPIPDDLIVGRAFVRIWPISAFKLL